MTHSYKVCGNSPSLVVNITFALCSVELGHSVVVRLLLQFVVRLPVLVLETVELLSHVNIDRQSISTETNLVKVADVSLVHVTL